MNGKTVIITGAASGVGLETAVALASKGASLVLVDIDPDRGRSALSRIVQTRSPARLFLADLSIQAEVRRVAIEIIASTPRVDVLINNAGAMFRTRRVTIDGLERTFALNHIGYFLLTRLLLQRIVASAPARIVSISSLAHRYGKIDFDDLQSEKHYDGMQAYFNTKLENVLFSRYLARRLEGTGVTSNSLEPGPGIIHTDFFKSAGFSGELGNGQTAAEGAKTSIYLASSTEVEGISGKYFANCQIISTAAQAEDDATAERLWEESLRLCRTA